MTHRDQQLGLLFDVAGDGYFEWDLATNEVTYSERWHELLGLEPNHGGSSIETRRERIHVDDLPRVVAAVDAAIRAQSRYAISYRVQHASGEQRWHLERGVVRGARLIAVIADITPFQAIDEHLEEAISTASRNELLLRETGRMARVGGWQVELPDSVFHWSDEVYRIHEITNHAQTPRSFEEWSLFIAPAERASALRQWQVAIEALGSWDMQLPLTTAKGNNIWVRSIGRVTRVDENGVRVFGALQDISDSKRTEQQLIIAHGAALEASRAKSQFVANMSHEIRTPLHGILGMAALTLATSVTEEQHEYLEAIRKSGLTLLDIVNDILDISKIEAGHFALEEKSFNAVEATFDAARTVAAKADERDVELVVNVDRDFPPMVSGDPVRFRQLVLNLLSNSVKFTLRGEIIVTLRYNRAQQQVECEVKDTGIGIAANALQRIFEPFTQADGSTTRRFGGTGLGLTISRELAQRMGGNIWAESEEGKGSSFHFAVRMQAAEVERVAEWNISGRALVLLANQNSSATLSAQLASLRFESTAVHDESQALAAIARATEDGRPFSCVFFDRPLVADIAAFAKKLGDLIKVMVVTSKTRVGLETFEELGLTRQVQKPVSTAMIRDCLAQTHQIKYLPTQAPEAAPARSLHVLLAEDNPINAKLASRILEKMGHRVVLAENGAEACAAQAREHFDLVLMDVQMPVMDGLDATRQIRSREVEVGGRVPIIALTANAMKGDDLMCLSAGMDDYLTKPLDPAKLREAILRSQKV